MSLRVFVTGASRGLGLELARQYTTQGARVFAAARNPGEGALLRLSHEHPKQLTLVPLDVVNEAQLAEAVSTVSAQAGALDLLINNAGLNAKTVGLGQYSSARMLELLHVNAVAPILIGQAFLELLRKGETPRLVNMSTQVGSFTWNTDGSAPLYAASKAALNMYTRAFSREATGLITIAVHPGWVQTDMGGSRAPLTVEQSVEALRTLIARLVPADNGQFFNYDGKHHPF
jgi:NAD(P)-dependent dehydrogenase (short-subunit alcohol dehydrogenase family)